MTINVVPNSGTGALNNINPNQIADRLRAMQFGSFVRADQIPLRQLSPNTAPANPYAPTAAFQSIILPDDAKALSVLRAYGRANSGSVTNGELTPKATAGSPYTNPTTLTVGVSASGDLTFLASDAWTNVDIFYQPERYDVVELVLPVASSIMTLPASLVTQGVVFMLEAQALVGTTIGTKFVQPPGAAPGTTGQANLSLAKNTVLFTVADAVTSARVKLGLCTAMDLNAFLETAQQY